MDQEWGPWIEHDGRGCPMPIGTFSQAKCRDGSVHEGKTSIWDYREVNAWLWHGDAPKGLGDVMEYRIRKPRGLTILEQLLQDLPAPVGPKVPA